MKLLIVLVIFAMMIPTIAYGQEVNSTEQASKNAKEILCNKYYELEYCEGQEVTSEGQEVTKCSTLICDDKGTDSANTTTLEKLEHIL